MNEIEQIIQVLNFRKRPDLANVLQGSYFTLNESSTYGSRLYSRLTEVELYAPIQKHEELEKLNNDDKDEIINAFQAIFPVRDYDMEIDSIRFLIDPHSIQSLSIHKITRLKDVDFQYIHDQISKCDQKIANGDFEGAITNARNLVESINLYVLDCASETYDTSSDLPTLYKKASTILNMHPCQHIDNSFKQILSGCVSIVQGLSSVRNELSDAHGKSQIKHYKPHERHAIFVVGVAKSLADFMYASFMDNVSECKKTEQ